MKQDCSIAIVNYLVLFAAIRFALTKPASMAWRNVDISLKISPVKQIYRDEILLYNATTHSMNK